MDLVDKKLFRSPPSTTRGSKVRKLDANGLNGGYSLATPPNTLKAVIPVTCSSIPLLSPTTYIRLVPSPVTPKAVDFFFLLNNSSCLHLLINFSPRLNKYCTGYKV